MKKIYFILVILSSYLHSFGQIPNPSFELWTGNQPNGWRSYANPPTTPYTCETTTNNAYNGVSALQSNVVYPGTTTLSLESGVVTGSASTNYYIPISTKPNKLFGWYILNCWNDTFAVNIWLKSGGVVIGSGKFQTQTSSATYTQFTVNITYTSALIPDSCKIDISFNQPGASIVSATSVGEFFIIDNLYFDINAGVEEKRSKENSFDIYPNPTSEIIAIYTDESRYKNSEIEIINCIGQSVLKTKFKKELDVSELSNGVYILQLKNSQNQIASKRLIIAK